MIIGLAVFGAVVIGLLAGFGALVLLSAVCEAWRKTVKELHGDPKSHA